MLVPVIILTVVTYRRRQLAHQHASQKDGLQRVASVLREAQFESCAQFVLPGACNGLVHIDCAVLTAAGIVCLRVKQVDGDIHGDVRDPQWKAGRDRREESFLNPVIQNEGRAAALRKVLPGTPVVGVVVFTGNVNLATVTADDVLQVSGLIDWLANLEAQHTGSKMHRDAWRTLSSVALTDDASIRDFRAQLSFG